MRTPVHLAAAAAAAAALGAAPALADDAFMCVPNKVSAGQAITIKFPGHPGIFGHGPSSGSWVGYEAGAASGQFKITSWTPDGIEVVTPKSISPGPVAVDVVVAGHHLPGPAGGCFEITVPVAPLRGIAAPVARQALTRVSTSDYPCRRDATITLVGTRFKPGTEKPPWGSGRVIRFEPMETRWQRGTTMVELGTTSDPGGSQFYTTYVSGLRIKSPTLMELTVTQCFVTQPGAKARIWFPDGAKSAWVNLRLPVGPQAVSR
jgi:hypothetical protein